MESICVLRHSFQSTSFFPRTYWWRAYTTPASHFDGQNFMDTRLHVQLSNWANWLIILIKERKCMQYWHEVLFNLSYKPHITAGHNFKENPCFLWHALHWSGHHRSWPLRVTCTWITQYILRTVFHGCITQAMQVLYCWILLFLAIIKSHLQNSLIGL